MSSPDGASADPEEQGRRTVPPMDLRHRDGGDTVGEPEEDLTWRTRRLVAGDDAAATVAADAAVYGRGDASLFSDQPRAAGEPACPGTVRQRREAVGATQRQPEL